MKIQKNAWVVVDYILSLENGTVIEKTSKNDPLTFIYGIGRMMPGLEKGLEGMEVGQKETFTVEPEDAYGNPNPALLNEISRADFPEGIELKKGTYLRAQGPQGPINFLVKEIKDNSVVCDFNHPLAGKRLRFEVDVVEVRKATEEDHAALAAADCGTSGDCSHGSSCSGCD